MQVALAKRIDELVELGWEPATTTETSASLVSRRPFHWWIFLFVVVFLPLFGGVFYLIFWYATSRVTLFLHQENEQVHEAGDLWLVRMQEARREAFIREQKAIKEQGFFTVMWPKLVIFVVMMALWIWFIRWYF
jgi:magnesium-transporting ATPase (P-type)